MGLLELALYFLPNRIDSHATSEPPSHRVGNGIKGVGSLQA